MRVRREGYFNLNRPIDTLFGAFETMLQMLAGIRPNHKTFDKS
jgi:hypothetical protein